MFCQNSPPWPVHLGWPYTAWLTVSLSWTRLWSMWSVWLVFCDCGFHSVCPLLDKDKRLMEASWWERLTEGKPGLVLMGGVILSKSLIQFSVAGGWGGAAFPPCLTWGQTTKCLQHLDAVSKMIRMISVHLQGKPFNITVIQLYAPTSNAESWSWTVLWPTRPSKKMSFSL